MTHTTERLIHLKPLKCIFELLYAIITVCIVADSRSGTEHGMDLVFDYLTTIRFAVLDQLL